MLSLSPSALPYFLSRLEGKGLIENLIRVVFCTECIDCICFVDFAFHRILDFIHLDFKDFIAVVLHRGYVVFKVLFNALADFAGFTDKKKLIFFIIEEENPAFFACDFMEVDESEVWCDRYVAGFQILLALADDKVWFW